MKLGLKLSLILLPLIAVPLILVGSLSYFSLLEDAKKQHYAEIKANLQTVADQVENLIANASASADLFAGNPKITYYLLTEDESIRYDLLYRPLMQEFISIQKAFPSYYELRLILPDGFEDLRSVNADIPNLTEDESNSSGLRRIIAAENPQISFIAMNPETRSAACYVYQRIELINEALEDHSATPKLRGYFALTADLGVIEKTLQQLQLGEHGGIFISNTKGQILALPTSLNWIQEHTQEWGEHLATQPSAEKHTVTIGSQTLIASHLKITDDLWVNALLPENELLASSLTVGKLVAVITLLALLISLSLLLYVLRNQLLIPINQLISGVLRIGTGEELVQLDMLRKDEFGQLGREFNQMSLALKKSNDQIRNMAFCDSLTQLPNRFMFNRNLKRLIEISHKEKTSFALLYLDLLKFKQVNDTVGHVQGDEMLREISRRVATNLRGSDTASRVDFDFNQEEHLSRLGGDEFCVLLPNIKSSINAAKAAERLIELVEKPVRLAGQEHSVSVSIGIAIYPDDGSTAVELIKNADLAMYEAKKLNKGSFQFFSRQLSEQVFERTRLEQRLIRATENRQFEVYYQPILDQQNLRIHALEALIRWHDEELGNVSPNLFIPVAEDIGLINSIGDWVLTNVCRQLRSWQSQGIEDIRVSVNISSRQFELENYAAEVLRTLKNEQVSTRSIYLELTESTLIQENNDVLANLVKLRQQGVKIALDDFGTGYSSLSYLRNLPIDILKIDRSFIQEVSDKNNSIILSAIITMAHALGMQVIAEGIEDQGQFAFLKKENCDFLQGFLFSRPEPVVKIFEKLKACKELKAKPNNISHIRF